ncbi:chemotaxis protein [Dasania marina]|uniref:chemotaxis protein n=1 Tax=Dasania marina TaxID=471499 RepID=UPI00036DA574|nr:chemotaxis protein [Dasania marina]
MSDLLKNVDSRTNLVGKNRLELLTFRLKGSQLFAINVFKVQEVQEVQKVPRFACLPKSNPVVVGVTTVRGETIAVIDLSLAVGRSAIPLDGDAVIIVTEYNRSLQAFVVGSVDGIVNLNWDEVMPPPAASGRDNFLTAITRVDGKIVEIIDVEKVLATVVHFDTRVSKELLEQDILEYSQGMEVLLVDDSRMAIEQASATLRELGLKVIVEMDGLKALRRLQQWRDEGIDVGKKLLMVITDAEMPEMDGYSLTTEIRKDPALKDLFVVLHTSLSGSFNHAMVKKVGCDGFLSKFQPDKMAEEVQARVKTIMLR